MTAGGGATGPGPSGLDRLLAGLQWPLPHHALSRLALTFASSRNRALKAAIIGVFRRLYPVDLSEAVETRSGTYPSFQAFFTRALAPGRRPIAVGADEIASPVDGAVSEAGAIHGDSLLQAKGRTYSVAELLAGTERAAPFAGGSFASLYLSPRDYHRVHMPLAGRLIETVHVPGRLFAVNPPAVRAIPRVFARNERVAAIFDTATGPMAVVLVGALLVGAIETVWAGMLTSPRGREIRAWPPDEEVALDKGDELGRFNMGSTVILLFGRGAVHWEEGLRPGAAVRMGERIGRAATG